MPQTPPSLSPQTWSPEPEDLTQGNARTVVFRMAGVMGIVVAIGIALLVAHWYTSRSTSVDFEEALASDASYSRTDGGGVSDALVDAGGAVLDVNSSVEGSTIFLNGDSVGVTPMQISLDEPGEQWVLITRGDQTLLDTTVQVEYGGVASVTARRRGEPSPRPVSVEPSVDTEAQRGAIRVTSAPAGAAVLLDGRRVGETPLTIDGLAAGQYALAVRRDGYESVARTVALRPGSRYEAALALRPASAPEPAAPPRPAPVRPTPAPAPVRPDPTPATGTVEVLVRPWGRIEIDGQVRQRESDVVYRTDLPVGTHRIRVSHPVLGSQERDVVVDRGVTYRIDVDLDGDG